VALARELEQKKSELVILNRDLENRNSAITRYRDQEKEIRELRDTLAGEVKKRLELEQENAKLRSGWLGRFFR
jgi:low affinity Fe/Cu permease